MSTIEVDVDLTLSPPSLSQPTISSYSLRSLFFLKVNHFGSSFPSSILRTALILHPEDAETLRKDFPALMRDVCNLLSEKVGTKEEDRFLSRRLFINGLLPVGRAVDLGQAIPDDFDEPVTLIGTFAQLECSLRLDLGPKYNCFTFNNVGHTQEEAIATVTSSASGGGKRPREDTEWTWISALPKVLLTIRAKHLESHKQRTLKLISDDPGKIAHYFSQANPQPVIPVTAIDDDIEKYLGQRPGRGKK
jgi:hypothetical protein